ncbi:protein kinase [Nocardiopsis eucommiae]|uniref:Protein kinase n=1 Tax=Nocardiopsis eucommiae TaxID=2831970 RepID=A0A975LD13_9ACTN|nr:protein kinase [Nocardiopsis eucommiae]
MRVEEVGGFRLLRSLGRGGFGEVFLGEAADGTLAAVKLLHASWSGDADMRRRFAAEVDQARRVSGFCVATILDADPDAAQPWIATEFIDGPTLQASVEADGPRTGVELQRLSVGTATALAAIHAAGVVHRDLKPDNIMLAPDGPRVIDFGIARAVESTSVTASGVVGTIGYMAPEQLEGARLTAAVDVFAWASVMVFAATGREAFPGPTQAARIARILGGEPDLAGLDGAFGATLRACLDKDPSARPDAETLMRWVISAPSGATPARATGGNHTPTTVAPGPDSDHTHTAVAPSSDARTRVGVDHTRVAGQQPTGVPPWTPPGWPEPPRRPPPATTRARLPPTRPRRPPTPGRQARIRRPPAARTPAAERRVPVGGLRRVPASQRVPRPEQRPLRSGTALPLRQSPVPRPRPPGRGDAAELGRRRQGLQRTGRARGPGCLADGRPGRHQCRPLPVPSRGPGRQPRGRLVRRPGPPRPAARLPGPGCVPGRTPGVVLRPRAAPDRCPAQQRDGPAGPARTPADPERPPEPRERRVPAARGGPGPG